MYKTLLIVHGLYYTINITRGTSLLYFILASSEMQHKHNIWAGNRSKFILTVIMVGLLQHELLLT